MHSPVSEIIVGSSFGITSQNTRAPEDAEHFFREGMRYLKDGNFDLSCENFRNAIEFDPSHSGAWHYLGIVFLKIKNLPESQRCVERSLELRKDNPQYYNNYGVLLRELGLLRDAFPQFLEAVDLDSNYADAWSNIGQTQLDFGNFADSEISLRKAILIQPKHSDAILHLGELLVRTSRTRESIEILHRSFSDFFASLKRLSDRLCAKNLIDEAIALREMSLDMFPDNIPGLSEHAGFLVHQERINEAVSILKKIAKLTPGNQLLKYRHLGLCPVVFQDVESIEKYWNELNDSLDELLDDNVEFDWKRLPYKGFIPSFHLSHHGKSCKEIRLKFGRLFARMFPHEKPKRQHRSNGKIRVGFLVCRGHEPGFCRVWGGIIERLDRKRFELFVICTEHGMNYCRKKINATDVDYVSFSDPFENAVRTIRSSDCDIIMHRKVGSDPWSYFLPFARLAPVQATSYGTHGTSGVPAVDYFLSSRLVEPDNAQEYYSENPYLLDSLPCFEKHIDIPNNVKREEFGLPEKVALYLCPHRPSKYHPDFDPYLKQILERDSNGHVVLLMGDKMYPLECLKNRFEKTIGPELMRRMIFMPSMQVGLYYRLLSLATMILDSSVYAGGLSSFDAFGLGVPEVTQSGPLHVQNYATGIYHRMEMPEMPVANIELYVALAVKLGTEPDYRAEISSRIIERNHLIFERSDEVPLWERFFEEIAS